MLVSGSATDGGILPRALDVIFNSISGQQWDSMVFKPDMFCAVTKLTPSEMQVQEKVKEKVMRMATDEVNKYMQLDTVLSASHFLCKSILFHLDDAKTFV